MTQPVTRSDTVAVTLRVAEARVDDTGHAIARVSGSVLDRLHIEPGAIVQITGRTPTVARVELADHPHDERGDIALRQRALLDAIGDRPGGTVSGEFHGRLAQWSDQLGRPV